MGGNENDIAIVGMAARLPGAPDVPTFWKNLCGGVESLRDLDDEALAAAGVSDALLHDPNYVKRAMVLDDVEGFDAEFFGFSPKEAAILDPQHRHFTEVCWEALENAGHTPERFDGNVSVFAGCGMGAYFAFNILSNRDLVDSVGLFLLRHTGNDKDFLATRVSYLLDLKGPSVNVQTACSTSLVATHMAVQSLLSGESDMALAGGVTIEVPHRVGYMFTEGEILSPDGHCRAFDHKSQGTVFGSGTGVVVLRRLQDALDDKDHIWGVIRGSAINNDGSGKVGYLAPSVEGQAGAVAEAIAVADVDARSIGYIETHGTGTNMGDPIEVSALSQAFRESTDDTGFCGIGSVKTNIGHLDTAAGVASLIKATLAVHHGKRPPSLNFEAPNPNIDFESSPFYVNSELSDWEGEGPRRAGVNSLGVGGTNAHVIVEQPPAPVATAPGSRPFQLLALSARNKKALDGACDRLADHLEEHPEQELADVAWTLLHGRRRFSQCRVLAAADRDEAIALLRSRDKARVHSQVAEEDARSVVFMLPGGGAQYPRMGIGLYDSEPEFRKHVDEGLRLLEPLVDFDLRDLWFAGAERRDEVVEAFDRPSVQLPAIFILEYSLARLWMSWGVQPAALIGHSMGENTAACLAGVMKLADAIKLVALRGQLFERVPSGGMLSVPLARSEVEPLLDDQLDLATVNSPELCVVSGPTERLDRFEGTLREREIEAQRVKISIAAHSRMLEPILGEFGDYLRSIELKPPEIPFISNRSGDWITPEQATDPEYWVQHLRNTVHFADGVTTLLQEPGRVFLEVGPGRTLSSLVRQNPAVRPGQAVVNSLRHPEEDVSDTAFFTTSMGRLWSAGVPVEVDRLFEGEERRRLPLPTYAFQHQRYWIDPGRRTQARESGADAIERHESLDDWSSLPVWRERALPRRGKASAEKLTCMVFVDGAGLGERLIERIRGAGHDVITVREGDAFQEISEWEFQIAPEQGREGYEALAHSLVQHGHTPRCIAHLWSVTPDESHRPGSSFFHRTQERGFYSLFFLAQALGGEGVRGPLHLLVASNGMQSVQGETLRWPEKATLLGPCRVIPREFPEFACTTLDLQLPEGGGWFGGRARREETMDRLADALLGELQAERPEATVALRDGGATRFVQEYETQPLDPAAEGSGPRLRSGGCYLITGGTGGLGMLVARHLAQRVRAKLVLLSRSAPPAPEQWDRLVAENGPDHPTSRRIRALRELESLGAQVLPVQADVTDVVAMRAGIQAAKERFGAIHGVFHTAGRVADNLIQIKEQAEVDEVFAPKLHGTLLLDELLADENLDFSLLFSSTSAVVAPQGQVDYVAANAFLDAYAQSRSLAGRPTVAVDWGIWSEVGMAAVAMGQTGNAGASRVPAEHPLLDERVREPGTHGLMTSTFSPSQHWLLDEHRTGSGHALIPGTGYIELAAAAVREHEEQGAFVIRDLFFFRPLHVPDGESRDVRIKLRRDPQGYSYEVQSASTLEDGRSGWQTHAQARIEFGLEQAPPPLDLGAVEARCTKGVRENAAGLRSKQEAHLDFGPRWRVLRREAYGDGEAIGQLELDPAFAADLENYHLHPALLDLATGFAMDLIEGYEAEELWVPVSYRSIKVHGRLPRQVVSWVRNRADNRSDGEFALFDVTITDRAGRVLLEVSEFAIRKLSGETEFTVAHKPSAAELELEAGADGGDGKRQLSPAELALKRNLQRGIRPDEGMEMLDRVLDGERLHPSLVVSSLPLDGLLEQAEFLSQEVEEGGARFTRPELDSDYVEPRDEIERTLVGFWEELLGVDRVGVQDDFFELGGHSLIAVRLFAKIKKAFDVDYPISVLFEAPTVEGCADMLRQVVGEGAGTASADGEASGGGSPATRFTHLVPMHRGEGGPGRPFFLVAGMFGNVLNLRHLAHLIGDERPFYGLQARGLFGDQQPHETFEEAARDYLAEIRAVQPEGPYLLGGFSGGGITAYEIARQLLAEGEEVHKLVFLDTPLPRSEPLSRLDKIRIRMIDLRREGLSYPLQWVRAKTRNEWRRLQRRMGWASPDQGAQGAQSFHNDAVEDAFRRALGRYEVQPLDLDVLLLRPKLNPEYVLGEGRMVNSDRDFVFTDNGWSGFVKRLEVVEVPGDHDSMVLEPNVRTLAARLRAVIQAVSAAEAR